MRYFTYNKNKYHCPTVNIDKLWSLLGEAALEAAAKDASTATVIDVTQHGYFKVLGKGVLPKAPVLLKAKFVSKLAEKKIVEAGGAVQLIA
jgi:large subunit ribosomal protein L27Ae